MVRVRQLGVVSILGACWFVAVGCGDEEDRKTGTEDGGEGGEGTGTSGSGGKSSIAGSQNNAGNAGKGGTTGGNAGNANVAGEGGSGSGGDAGGGMVAGAGGETPGGGGEGGVATAGAGGEGGAPEPEAAMCKYQCDGPEDCMFADAVPHKCNLVTGSCAECVADADCMVGLIGWASTCENVSECDFPDTQACVAWQGVGYCADLPDVNSPEFPCLFGGRPQMVPLFSGQGDIEVCAADARCFDGRCEAGCTDPLGECGFGNGDTCNPTTGRCECEMGTECDTEVCGTDSRCAECVTPQDCPGGTTGRDACVNGKCGCAGVNSCTRAYVGNPPKTCE
jgi:hypothetical protein